MEARDVRYTLAHRLGMAVPSDSVLGGTVLSGSGGVASSAAGASAGATSGGPTGGKRSAGFVAHQQRMALIDKTLKKL